MTEHEDSGVEFHKSMHRLIAVALICGAAVFWAAAYVGAERAKNGCLYGEKIEGKQDAN